MEQNETNLENELPQFENRIELQQLSEAVNALKGQLGQIIFGQEYTIDQMLIGLLCEGHILLEGVPGVAKTLLSRLLALSVDIGYRRIQFTPDLMPSDILGTSIFNPKSLEFEYRKGPVFANFVLIDEVNRSPAKTQAALFELMEERQVSIDGRTYPMEEPFMVVATQNPVEQEGTYRLPEAQLDRFLLKIVVDYPSEEAELKMLSNFNGVVLREIIPSVKPVLSGDQIIKLRETVRSIKLEDKLLTYISGIIRSSRSHRNIDLGASPRAGIALLQASKGQAAINGRDFVTPDDIKRIGKAVLKHRIILRPEAEIEGITIEETLEEIFNQVEIPS
jgi:MoxR-like ATPase